MMNNEDYVDQIMAKENEPDQIFPLQLFAEYHPPEGGQTVGSVVVMASVGGYDMTARGNSQNPLAWPDILLDVPTRADPKATPRNHIRHTLARLAEDVNYYLDTQDAQQD